jgi:hypothetical protein
MKETAGRFVSLDAFRGFTIKCSASSSSFSRRLAAGARQAAVRPIRALPLAPANTSLLYALLFNAFMLGIAWVMWRKKCS